MNRLQVELPDEVIETLNRRAGERGISVSDYVREILQRETADDWPEDFFENVVGAWKGEPLERPAQGDFEEREKL